MELCLATAASLQTVSHSHMDSKAALGSGQQRRLSVPCRTQLSSFSNCSYFLCLSQDSVTCFSCPGRHLRGCLTWNVVNEGYIAMILWVPGKVGAASTVLNKNDARE